MCIRDRARSARGESPSAAVRIVRVQRQVDELALDPRFVDRGHDLDGVASVSYTHLRAHETVLDLVCRLLLEKKNK